MNTCENCQYWKRNTLDDEDQDQEGDEAFRRVHGEDAYKKMKDLEEKKFFFGSCSNPKFVYVQGGIEEAVLDGLNYWDYESYYASFETGEKFGCIHFEKRS
jgi:hypothetical protein